MASFSRTIGDWGLGPHPLQGLDFRSTAIFVTDPSGYTSEVGTTANYPRTTPQGLTVGWEATPSGTRNRSAAVDARLAGVAFNSTTTEQKYRVDLPNGSYLLDLAIGDDGAGQSTVCHIYDGASLLATITGTTVTGAFLDATGTLRSTPTDWVANHQPLPITITTGILRIGIARVTTGSGVVASAAITNGVTETIAAAPFRPLTDTGLTVTDALASNTRIADTGLTVTDTVASLRLRPLTVTGLTVTDSLAKTGVAIAVTGLTVTDSVASLRLRPLTATGLTLTDRILQHFQIALTDTGATITDSLHRSVFLDDTALIVNDSLVRAAAVRTRALTDTGLAFSDSLARSYPRTTTSTGLTVTDSLDASKVKRFLTDTGATIVDGIYSAGPHRFNVTPIDRGLTVTDSLALHVSLAPRIADAGLVLTDGILVTGGTTPSGPFAAFSWSLSLTVLTVDFTNLSTPGPDGPISSWIWSFGDGDTDTTDWSPSHAYVAAGTYVVTLTVTSPDGISAVSHPVTVAASLGAGFHVDAVIV